VYVHSEAKKRQGDVEWETGDRGGKGDRESPCLPVAAAPLRYPFLPFNFCLAICQPRRAKGTFNIRVVPSPL
jgi:hypothetical protein